MNTGFEKRLVVVWLSLSAITLAQLSVGSIDGQDGLAPNAAIAAGAIGIALIKVRIIFREFMEVRHAPVLLGRLTDLWIVLTGAILLGGYLAGMSFAPGRADPPIAERHPLGVIATLIAPVVPCIAIV